MEVVLEEFKAGRYPNLKQDLAKRKLTKGVVSYEFTSLITDKYNEDYYMGKFLLPFHESLRGNKDYENGNIVIFSIFGEKRDTKTFGILFNKIDDWAELPDDLWFKHGRNKLVVKNITKG